MLDDIFENYKKAIQEIRSLLKGKVELESDSILETIYYQRYHWKPKRVRLLLLAESHVYTSPADYKIMITNTKYQFPPGCIRYTKFIYCLGHGEKDILSAKPLILGRTPQFWKIFYGLFHNISLEKNAKSIPVLKTHKRNLNSRLTEKVNLLEKMRDNGIWLLDASPVAIAGTKGIYPYYNQIMEISCKYYLRPLFEKMQPERVLIIGKRVENAIQPILHLKNSDTIPQPTAFLNTEAKTKLFSDVFKIGKKVIKHG